MEATENYLQVLSDSLDRKIVILEEIQRLTDSQRNIASGESFDDKAFENTIEKKSVLIEQITKLDSGFQLLYDNIKEQLENSRSLYKNEIAKLQQKIKIILDKNAALQTAEQSNRNLITKRFGELKKEIYRIKKSRDTAANYYKTMNNITSEPFFLDQKK